MELAEVAAANPGIECILFPKKSPAEVLALLSRLRDLFGKEKLSQEDAYRLESIRQGTVFRREGGEHPSEVFLKQAEARLSFDFQTGNDARVLELVNKTNQFNLNGVRHTEADWSRANAHPEAFLIAVDYRDKFGPLGKIAVIRGRRGNARLCVDVWVMSCRAFARRIEHQTLRTIFNHTGAAEALFDFAATARNGPLVDFLASVAGAPPQSAFRLTRSQFDAACPALYQELREMRRAEAHG
jgi:FkbH-like protein